jgi:hypothetical protein
VKEISVTRNPALFSGLALLHATLTLGQTPVLVLLRGDAQSPGGDQAIVETHLRALGASGVVRYSAINAIDATLPALTADRLAADPKVAHILSYDNASSRSFAELLRQIDHQAKSATGRVVSGAAPPSGPLSDLLDRLIDDHQLNVVLQGDPVTQANAITVGATAASGMRKPDFMGAGSGRSIEVALTRLGHLGVSSALARKALLINTAGSGRGWSPDSGWGEVNPDAIDALNTGQPVCVDQKNAGSGSSACFTGAIATTQDYETKSASPARITVVWNRSFPAGDSPYTRNLEIHVYDHAHNELAFDNSTADNVQQITAQSDSGLMVRVKLTQPIGPGEPEQPFALVSSVPLTTAPHTCTNVNSIAPSTMNFPSQGGTQSVTISVDPACNWQLGPVLTGMDIFAIPAQTSGIGPATVAVTAGPNPFNIQLTEHLVLMPDGFLGPYSAVTQDAGSTVKCSYTAAATGTLPILATGGSAGIGITASPSTCTSSASSNANWLTLSLTSGTGNWSPVLTASPNIQTNASTSSRMATVTVSGTTTGQTPPFSQGISITQSGLQCTFTLPTTPFNIPAGGIPQSSPQSFNVGVSNAACQLTASSGSTTFLYVINDGVVQTGLTSYKVQYWAAATTDTASRPAYIQAGGQTCAGNQDGKNPSPPPNTFDATVAADDVFGAGLVANLVPGDLTVKQGGTVVKANVSNLAGDGRILQIQGLDATKTFTLTLNLANYTVSPAAGLDVSKAHTSALFDAYANTGDPQPVDVDVKDFSSSPIPGALITLTASDASTVTGRTDAKGNWSGYRKGTKGITYTAKAEAAGYTFADSPQNVTKRLVRFKSQDFTGQVDLVLNPDVGMGPSDLSTLIDSIDIQVAPAAPASPTKTSSGNTIHWSMALDPAKTYTVTFKSTSTVFKVSFPGGNLQITEKKPDLKESAGVVKR